MPHYHIPRWPTPPKTPVRAHHPQYYSVICPINFFLSFFTFIGLFPFIPSLVQLSKQFCSLSLRSLYLFSFQNKLLPWSLYLFSFQNKLLNVNWEGVCRSENSVVRTSERRWSEEQRQGRMHCCVLLLCILFSSPFVKKKNQKDVVLVFKKKNGSNAWTAWNRQTSDFFGFGRFSTGLPVFFPGSVPRRFLGSPRPGGGSIPG